MLNPFGPVSGDRASSQQATGGLKRRVRSPHRSGIWYICGGGDGSGPRKEMLSLSLTAEALEWVIFDVDAKGPLAREGLSVLAVPGVPGGGLVAFGGYDGKYHCDLSCLRPGCV